MYVGGGICCVCKVEDVGEDECWVVGGEGKERIDEEGEGREEEEREGDV